MSPRSDGSLSIDASVEKAATAALLPFVMQTRAAVDLLFAEKYLIDDNIDETADGYNTLFYLMMITSMKQRVVLII